MVISTNLDNLGSYFLKKTSLINGPATRDPRPATRDRDFGPTTRDPRPATISQTRRKQKHGGYEYLVVFSSFLL